ncbi:transcriptional regulator with XRE-family HTH domain [Sinorhizobium fredii]|uniref:helix-turn-helix domain-containing protein n=1 Tax=Rhizobium fredii TaxID=380 RepID=UPI0035152959
MNQDSLKNSTAEMDIRIGSRIRHFRNAQAMSQSTLAGKVGVSFQQLQKYEKGTNRISASALIIICKALAITPNDVLDQFIDDDAPSSAVPEFVAGAALVAPGLPDRIAA